MIKKNNPFNSDKKISKKYLLKNGSIIDVIKNKIIKEDLYIKNKVVEKIGKNLSKIVDEDTEIIDCKNLYISPGFIETAMTDKIDEKFKEVIISKIPSARLGQPEDIANAVLFLVSNQSDYINGETLHVNGGMYMAWQNS